MASRNDIALPSAEEDKAFASPEALLDRYERFTSLDDFLHYYFIGMSCLIEARDFEELAWDYFLKAKDQAVHHAEVFFDPQAHTSRGVSYMVVVEGFGRACEKAEKELNISTKLILCFLRHLPTEGAQETWRTAATDFSSGKLAGIGLSGSEKGRPPGPWQGIFHEAKRIGVQRTAHAGEEGPVGYIKMALRECDVQRIDHGIKLAEDEELMNEVAKRRILVTLCPLSNLKLRCVSDVKQLPIRKFLDAGVNMSINSDDPAYFTSYIQDNYCAVQEAFELKLEEWEVILRAAVDCSWCSRDRKRELLVRIDEAIDAYRALP